MGVHRNAVRCTLGARFNTRFSVHASGHMMADLANLFPEITFPDEECGGGYMARLGEHSDDFNIAVIAIDDCKNLDRGTVLSQFGHYIEQRVVAHRQLPFEPLAMRNTAFLDAYEVVNMTSKGATCEQDLRRAADQLCAWTNAIWLCWMLKISPKIVVVGMALDATNYPSEEGRSETCGLVAAARVLVSHTAAEHMFTSAGPFTLKTALRPEASGNDVSLCQQINLASSLLLESIRADVQGQTALA